MKKVIIISSSPVMGGNSDRLCDEFLRGTRESGNSAEKVFLRHHRIHFCSGCRMCDNESIFCSQKDDAVDIIRDMLRADVIVLATPCYFSSMSAQLKTLIDRCLSAYRQMSGKEFYFIVTGSSADRRMLYPVVKSLEEFVQTLRDSRLCGVIYGSGLRCSGSYMDPVLLEHAYSMGRRV